MVDWQYSTTRNQYRNPATGRYVSQRTMLKLHDDYADARSRSMADLASQVADGSLDVPSWEQAMREEIKAAHGAQYLLGRGGKNTMEAVDWLRLESLVRDQMRYLTNFSRALADGKLSEAQLVWRSGLYAHAARQAFERGRASAFELVLPVYPADGGTACKSRCHCHWEIKRARRRITATWRLGIAEHCEDCKGREARYREYVVERGTEAA